jgi:hypothetical protein
MPPHLATILLEVWRPFRPNDAEPLIYLEDRFNPEREGCK